MAVRYPTTPGDELRAREREALLDAGLEVFGTTGYRGVTAEELAARAGLDELAVDDHFGDTETLLLAVYHRILGDLRAQMLDAIAGVDGGNVARLRTALRTYFAMIADDPRTGRIQLVEVRGVSPVIDDLYLASNRSFAELLRAEAAVAGYQGAAVHDEQVALELVNAVVDTARAWLDAGLDEPVDDVTDRCLELFAAVRDDGPAPS